MTDKPRKAVLDGIRVLDLSRVLSGPYCTMILADQGADVVKVEKPESGDAARQLGPPYVGEDSAFFVSINRNKRSLVLDLKTPEGKTLLNKLVDQADVVVENFRPGVADRLGCGYAEASKRNPQLIYCSISGFGQSGPYRNRPGYNMTVQALSGAMTLTGEPDSSPYPIGLPVGDIPAGIYAATAIAMALFQRERTGEGRWIDISLLDAILSMEEFPIVRFGLTGENPGAMGRHHPSISPYGIFNTSDAEIAIAVGSETLWIAFCQALGKADWCDDPRFTSNAARCANANELREEVEMRLETEPSRTWTRRLHAAGIPVSSINRISDVFEDPHVNERGMITRLNQPGFGEVAVAGTAIRWAESDTPSLRPAPRLGEHSRDILRDWLTLNPTSVDALIDRGTVAEF